MSQREGMNAYSTQIASLLQKIDIWGTETPKQENTLKSELGCHSVLSRSGPP